MTMALAGTASVYRQEMPGVVDHRGEPLAAGREFFMPVPPEIGALRSAHSTLKAGRDALPAALRVAIIALVVGPAVGLAFYRNPNIIAPGREEWIPWAILSATLTILLLPIVWLATRFKVRCSYVGPRGAVRYTCLGPVGAKVKTEKILFEEAEALYVSGKRYKVGTAYTYTWVDGARRIVCRIRGKFTSSIGMSPDDPVHFVRAAEAAWSEFSLARADAEVAATGHVRFSLGGDHYVLVAPGAIEFHRGGGTVRCEAGDIRSMTLFNGTFSIVHRDATWYSAKGRFTFPYAAMPNALLFRLVVERFLPQSTWAA